MRFAWPRSPGWTLEVREVGIATGERVFLAGPSGAGKSSLLSLVGGIQLASHGRVMVLGTDMATLSGRARDRFRAEHIGIIFQSFNLLPYLSALENAVLPCELSAARRMRALEVSGSPQAEARRLLARLGITDERQLLRPAATLSIGQQQRVAAARALIGRPELVIADEPTSALDTVLRGVFIDLLCQECAQVGSTLLFVSHDRALAGHFDRCIELSSIARTDAEG